MHPSSYPAFDDDTDHSIAPFLTSRVPYPSPLRFGGGPLESSSVFAYNMLLQLELDGQMVGKDAVIFISSFLDGRAFKWYAALLGRNFEDFRKVENDRRERGYDRPSEYLAPKSGFPFDWNAYPFVLPELRTCDALLEALQAAFPDPDEVAAPGERAKAASACSEWTLSWDEVRSSV